MAAASLHALLKRSIDYAGLFPPANLALAPALHNHAQYVRDPDEWMLGAFILPMAKFGDPAINLSPFDLDFTLRVSALGTRSEKAAEFIATEEIAAEAIRGFHPQHGPAAFINQIEIPLPLKVEAKTLAEASAFLAEFRLPIFWETSADDAERVIALLAQQNANGGGNTSGFKLRTGGVVAAAFPSSVQIARALVAAVRNQVPIKFTAGLHHPVRQFHTSVQTKMHGFLNVLGAGVLAAEHGWSQQQTAAMLDDEDATSFRFEGDNFSWLDWNVSTERIKTHRQLITSLGSCSFDEPREDLRALQLL